MARVRLLFESYERYTTLGDRKSLVILRRGDEFVCGGRSLIACAS